MKDCKIYFRKSCTCEEVDYCYENNGECKYMIDKKECIGCVNNVKDILKCYGCKKVCNE